MKVKRSPLRSPSGLWFSPVAKLVDKRAAAKMWGRGIEGYLRLKPC